MLPTPLIALPALLLLLVAAVSAQTAPSSVQASELYTIGAKLDHVPALPGIGVIAGFNLFAGYITVDAEAGRALFYAFAESRIQPDTAPLVLWNNGGPGCSSLGGGFLSELGPFLPLPGNGAHLQINQYAWNRIANVVFLESPAFVGFSYSNTSEDKVVGDARTASDSRAFMLGFYQRFPYLRANDFYLSGESYGGHYIPNLALEIVKGNMAASESGAELSHINLRGFLLGNAWTDANIDNKGTVDFWWHHALISDQTLEGIKDTCDFSNIGPLSSENVASVGKHDSKACDRFCGQASRDMGNINIYEIFADVCLPARLRSTVEHFATLLGDHPSGLASRVAVQQQKQYTRVNVESHSQAAFVDGVSTAGTSNTAGGQVSRKLMATDDERTAHMRRSVPEYDPCVDNEVEAYLNMPQVQKALHANQTHILAYPWSDCSSHVDYSRKDLLKSMLPVYDQLLWEGGPGGAGLRMLVYSGDVDGIVPVVGSRRWIATLRLKETKAWRPWYSQTQQVGGYVVEYGNFSFATVRNAGHMVPYVQPERTFHMLQRFLAGHSL